MKATEKQKLSDFRAAKKIAITIPEGEMRRATNEGHVTNYTGANIGGRMFVIGDSLDDISNPDGYVNGKPAREVFGEFSILYK